MQKLSYILIKRYLTYTETQFIKRENHTVERTTYRPLTNTKQNITQRT